MPHAATNIITAFTAFTRNACSNFPSSSNHSERYKITFRNRLAAVFESAAIFFALIKFEWQPVYVLHPSERCLDT